MELTITKEMVLDAAGKCDTAKATLEALFPECFKEEPTSTVCTTADGLVIDRGHYLCIREKRTGGRLIETRGVGDDRYVEKAFWLGNEYDWTLESAPDGGMILIPRLKIK